MFTNPLKQNTLTHSKLTLWIFILCILSVGNITNAQSVGINNSGTSPDPSAMLDVQSTSKGMLIPRMTTAQRTGIAGPADGLLVFDTDTQSFWYCFNLVWSDLSNAKMISDADQDTKIEVEKSADEDSIRFTVLGNEIAILDHKTFHLNALGNSVFMGKDAGKNDDGSDNNSVGIGYESLKNESLGWNNTAVGYKSLSLNDAGDNNTAIGVNTMYKTHFGDFNVAVGNSALYENSSGAGNIAVGYQALRNNLAAQRNVAVGHKAMFLNESGETNVAVGSKALYYSTNIDDLVAIGDSSLFNNGIGAFGTQGTANVAIGSRSLKNNTTGSHNTAVGLTSMEENINGIHNTSVGDRSMEKSQSGNHNAGFGSHSLHLNIDGDFNTAHGSYSLFNNTSGSYNTAVGTRALFYNNQQSSSVAVGDSSLFNNGLGGGGINNGEKNTAVGKSSGISNQTGSENVYVGFEAGANNLSGSGNIFLGNEAGSDELGGNKLYIENSASTSPLIYGEFDNDLVRVNGTLNINNEYSFPSVDGAADEVLTTDGSGQLTWDNPDHLGIFEQVGSNIRQKSGYNQTFIIGRDALPVNNIGVNDTFMFFDAGKAAFRAGQLRVSSKNWAPDSIGFASVAFGENTKAKGSRSTAFGSYTQALGDKSMVWGSASIASGSESTAWGVGTASDTRSTAWGTSFSHGVNSTAWGSATIADGDYSTSWGDASEAIGQTSTAWGYQTEAEGYSSTAWGSQTLASGTRATAWGNNAEATGSYSTAAGDYVIAPSGYEMVFGRYNTTYAPDNTPGWDIDDRLFVIGNGTSNTQRSNALTILKNGNFGIGTDDPIHSFDIRANSVFNNDGMDYDFRVESDNHGYMLFVDAGNNRTGIAESNPEGFLHIDADNTAPALVLQGGTQGDLTWPSTSDLNLGTWNFTTNTYTEFLQIENTGEVGINTTIPNGMLHIKQDAAEKAIRIENDAATNHWSYEIGNSFLYIYYNDNEVGYWNNSTGSYTATSDRRSKKDITYMDTPILDKIIALKPATYRLNFADADSQKAIGFIAQEVEEYLPEVVRHKDEGDGLGLNYSDFGVLAIKAIQEQQELIDAQKELIEGLLKRVDVLEKE